ncbi:hypothetical protein DYL61_25525 [Pseudomonas nabeulensis]|uniref:Uncharacterized protein n=1 Tax=Pseudomonas nabeulensis TaxID=2293833 RepID=A0A4Z0AMX6_9PSED|nr:hypothetical protein DYL61_25525 [Pseudomonas nabeulensis]
MPPIAVGQLTHAWLTHCYRGQAPSHIGSSLFGRCPIAIHRHSAPILPSRPNWAFFLQQLAGILGRPFPWCRPPLCFAP